MERINFFNFRAQTHPPVADYINEVRQWPDLPPQSKFLRQGSGKHELHKPFLFKRKCWFLLSAYIPGELRSFAYLAGIGIWEKCLCKLIPDLHPQCHFQSFTHGNIEQRRPLVNRSTRSRDISFSKASRGRGGSGWVGSGRAYWDFSLKLQKNSLRASRSARNYNTNISISQQSSKS